MTSKVPQKMPEGLGRPKAPAAPPTRDMRVSVEYKLVPTELTDEMADSSGCEGYFKMSPHEQAQEMWEAMLAAAPAVQGEVVGRVKTVGGYPDESEHTVEWLCKYRDLKDGDLLYTTPQPAPDVTQLAEAHDDQYPPCDYCGVIPDHHPWHGSGMYNGEDSPHIHACNDCRHLLPTRLAQTEQQPDVAALVEALERIRAMDSMSYHSLESAKIVAHAALSAHRKGGDTP